MVRPGLYRSIQPCGVCSVAYEWRDICGRTFSSALVSLRPLGTLYSLRSGAVHTGRLSSDQKVTKQLQEGCRVTAEAIRRFIEEGPPDWKAVQLG
jgi:hypothetical protein